VCILLVSCREVDFYMNQWNWYGACWKGLNSILLRLFLLMKIVRRIFGPKKEGREDCLMWYHGVKCAV